jgi:hypothetical protein
MKLRKPSILVVNWVSSCLFFFLSASTAATDIFSAPNCTTTIISLEPCALNAEYQHFILRFIKMSLLCGYHWKRGYRVKGGPKTGWRQGYSTDNSNTTGHLTPHSQNRPTLERTGKESADLQKEQNNRVYCTHQESRGHRPSC